jgi:alpha-N-acetylglucosaminidase
MMQGRHVPLLPESFYNKQIQLNHQILNRIQELDMHPIVPAFAGFVPPGIQKSFPEEKVMEPSWGGWVNEYAAKTWSGLIRD